jgi:hypothetical protein
LVGTIFLVGGGKLCIQDLEHLLQNPRIGTHPLQAPAHGLYLLNIENVELQR